MLWAATLASLTSSVSHNGRVKCGRLGPVTLTTHVGDVKRCCCSRVKPGGGCGGHRAGQGNGGCLRYERSDRSTHVPFSRTFLLGPNGNPGSSATPFSASSHPWSSANSGPTESRLLRLFLLAPAPWPWPRQDWSSAAGRSSCCAQDQLARMTQPGLRGGSCWCNGGEAAGTRLTKLRERRCGVDLGDLAVLGTPRAGAVA